MKTFEELDLISPIQRSLADEKYTTPTPIQAQTIPAALLGRDVIGCAQTGTGKTAAFALPILSQLGEQNAKAVKNHPFVLILAPTRELAIQIGESFATYGKHLRLRQALVYGGVNQTSQVRALQRGAQILIATPGRLLDLMNQGHITLNQLQMFVLDEADQMLDMGFLPDLKRIIKTLPKKRQSLFFSATLSPKITELSRTLLKDPVSVNVTPKTTSVERIKQRLLFVEQRGKQALLRKILLEENIERTLVFTKTKRAANMLVQQLERSGVKAVAIHGNKSQNARIRALDAFRNNQVQVLAATDVAARGIDIDRITHVINYDLPIEPEVYVHRIGRTGRAGEKGIALSFCCGAEIGQLRAIERLIGQKIPVDENSLPEPKEERPAPRSRGGNRFRAAGKPRNKTRRSSSSSSRQSRSERSNSQQGTQNTSSKHTEKKRPASTHAANVSAGENDRPKKKRPKRKRSPKRPPNTNQNR